MVATWQVDLTSGAADPEGRSRSAPRRPQLGDDEGGRALPARADTRRTVKTAPSVERAADEYVRGRKALPETEPPRPTKVALGSAAASAPERPHARGPTALEPETRASLAKEVAAELGGLISLGGPAEAGANASPARQAGAADQSSMGAAAAAVRAASKLAQDVASQVLDQGLLPARVLTAQSIRAQCHIAVGAAVASNAQYR
ncbi:unnamed protein product, partial [Prorocentrum cordatum]